MAKRRRFLFERSMWLVGFALALPVTGEAVMAAPKPQCSIHIASPGNSALDRQKICARFRDRLLQDVGDKRDLSTMRIELKILDQQSIEAAIFQADGANSPIIPPIIIDVMDRSPNLADVEALAKVVSRAILNQTAKGLES